MLKQFEMMQNLTRQISGGKMPKALKGMMGGGVPGMGASAVWAAWAAATPKAAPSLTRSVRKNVDLRTYPALFK